MNVTVKFDFGGLIVCEIVIRQNVTGIVEKISIVENTSSEFCMVTLAVSSALIEY